MSIQPVSAGSLREMFASVPDRRDPRGRRYSAASVLSLSAVAMMSGAASLSAIGQFAADRPGVAEALGLLRPSCSGRSRCTPGVGQLHYFFKDLDVARFEAAVTAWILVCSGGEMPEAVLDIDGKVLRGSRDGPLPGVKLLAAYGRRMGSALAQLQVARDTNEHKAALQLLKVLPLEGVTAVGDAAFCQKDFCEAVTQAGGDYVVMVRGNQPDLQAAVAAAFGPADSPCGIAAATN
jgi:hypothetical protein